VKDHAIRAVDGEAGFVADIYFDGRADYLHGLAST
jgi:hypothetical protein